MQSLSMLIRGKLSGKDGIFLGVQPSSDANIVQLTNDVEKVVNELNETTLKKEGLNIKWIYDQRPYIVGSVDLVQQNISDNSLEKKEKQKGEIGTSTKKGKERKQTKKK